jgi:P27 family predicted phage terminase small subunit
MPTAIKLAKGETRPSRHNSAEPPTLPLRATPRAPAWLGADARVAWRELVALLMASRVLGRQDVALLAVLCDQIAVYQDCAAFLAARGVSFVVSDGDGNPKGVQAYPEVALRQRAAEQVRKLCEHFGLSPASRTRIAASDAGRPASALETFLRQA